MISIIVGIWVLCGFITAFYFGYNIIKDESDKGKSLDSNVFIAGICFIILGGLASLLLGIFVVVKSRRYKNAKNKRN